MNEVKLLTFSDCEDEGLLNGKTKNIFLIRDFYADDEKCYVALGYINAWTYISEQEEISECEVKFIDYDNNYPRDINKFCHHDDFVGIFNINADNFDNIKDVFDIIGIQSGLLYDEYWALYDGYSNNEIIFNLMEKP